MAYVGLLKEKGIITPKKLTHTKQLDFVYKNPSLMENLAALIVRDINELKSQLTSKPKNQLIVDCVLEMTIIDPNVKKPASGKGKRAF